MIIYLTTNLINGKKYIGKDQNNNPKYLGSGTALRRAIKKYGIENFQKEILEECNDLDQLDIREAYWINIYNAVNSKEYYNLRPGGTGGGYTRDEVVDVIRNTIKKLWQDPSSTYNSAEYREKKKGHIPWNKGRTDLPPAWNKGKAFSDETKKKMSEASKGQIPWNKGKTGVYSNDTIKKMSESSKGQIPWNKGKSWSEETKKKMSESAKSRNIDVETEKERKRKIGLNNKSATPIIDTLTNNSYISLREYQRNHDISYYQVKKLLKDGILKYDKN